MQCCAIALFKLNCVPDKIPLFRNYINYDILKYQLLSIYLV